MKKHAILIILCSMLPVVLPAQGKDAKATALLDEVSRKAKSHKSIKVEFSYTMVNAKAGINEERTGTLLVAGDKYRMTAAGQTVISDGKTVWTYIKESNEVQVNDLDNKDDAMTPSKLLTSYNANFKSKIVRSQDPALEAVELTPTSGKNFTRAILGIDKSKKQVRSFTLYDKSGNTFTYKIKSYLTDTPAPDSEFTFDAKKYPGVEVIDMR